MAEQMLLSGFFDNVPWKYIGLSDFDIIVNYVGKIGEKNAKLLFIFAEPLFRGSVSFLFPFDPGIGADESGDLGSPSNSPISKS